MSSTAFHVMLFLPSFAFVLLVLSTFYGVRRAYLALCWVPFVLFILVDLFRQLSVYQPSHVNLPDISQAIVWTGLVQSAVGAALGVRAARLNRGYAGLLGAACLSAAPYLLSARG